MASRQTRQLLDLLDGFEMTKSQHDWLERRFENMTVGKRKPSVPRSNADRAAEDDLRCDADCKSIGSL